MSTDWKVLILDHPHPADTAISAAPHHAYWTVTVDDVPRRDLCAPMCGRKRNLFLAGRGRHLESAAPLLRAGFGTLEVGCGDHPTA
ncbi:hypothetical protein NBRGN_054_01050 [Nocardia brasiliensis NBRC 14402]|nr:hypothetical protein NBRGN_054_01050 [Nocardia brasiliensis NBRC 14402]